MRYSTDPRRLAVLVLLSAGLGLAGGGAAWLLIRLIRILTNLCFAHEFTAVARSSGSLRPSPWLFGPALLGALAIALLAKWAPVIRGHGIPEAMEAVLTRQSRIPPRTMIAKPLSAAIAIGTGAPFGAEGPIIVTGGSIGSLVGQLLPVTPAERKILLAAGAAAGMAATFGAPIASVVLAIELLSFEFSARALLPLAVASAVAGGMHAALFGNGPLFPLPSHNYEGLALLPAFALLGIVAGLLAVLVSRGLFFVEGVYRRLPIDEFWHPAIGAIGFVVIGLAVPRTLGVGYDVIGDVVAGRLTLATVAVLAAFKLLSWWIALGSGTSGGTLAPILLISASFGTVLGAGLNRFLPGSDVALGAYATVAMAATFGAAAQATFTAIIFVFELTRDYSLILPLMVATVLADLIYSSLNQDSLMTEKLSRRGLWVSRHYSPDPFSQWRVCDVMTTEVVTVPHDATVGEVRQTFATGGHSAYPVVDREGRVVAIVTRGDLLRWSGADTAPVLALASRYVVTVAPDEPAAAVLRAVVTENVDHVPVVAGDGRLVGICTRTDLLRVHRRQLELERAHDGGWLRRRGGHVRRPSRSGT